MLLVAGSQDRRTHTPLPFELLVIWLDHGPGHAGPKGQSILIFFVDEIVPRT